MTKRRLFVECHRHDWETAESMYTLHGESFRGWLESCTGSRPGLPLLTLVRKHKDLGEPSGRLDFGRGTY